MDHLYRVRKTCDHWDWTLIMDETRKYLLDNGNFYRFYSEFFTILYPKWYETISKIDTSASTIVQSNLVTVSIVKKIIWIWNFAHRLIKPVDILLGCNTRWD
jgi:hypothetical protein